MSTCLWYDEDFEADRAHQAIASSCTKEATHYSCCWAGDASKPNVCEEHKCRCAAKMAPAQASPMPSAASLWAEILRLREACEAAEEAYAQATRGEAQCPECRMVGQHKLQCSQRPDPQPVLSAADSSSSAARAAYLAYETAWRRVHPEDFAWPSEPPDPWERLTDLEKGAWVAAVDAAGNRSIDWEKLLRALVDAIDTTAFSTMAPTHVAVRLLNARTAIESATPPFTRPAEEPECWCGNDRDLGRETECPTHGASDAKGPAR